MKHARLVIPFLAAGFALFCAAYSLSPLAGGGTIETTGGRIIGTIAGENGTAAQNTLVWLCPAEYDPVKHKEAVLVDTTDSRGRYAFEDVPPGAYTMTALHTIARTRAIATGITMSSDSTVVPCDTLRKAGSAGIMFPESWDPVNGYVYIPGTKFSAALISSVNGRTILDSLPSGTLPGILFAIKGAPPAAAPIRVVGNFQLTPGETLTIGYPGWLGMRKLSLNTTAGGAGITEHLLHFPVLVRLTQSNFAFYQAQSTGGDLRFSKSDGTPLAFEIDQWDAAAGTAAVWVRVDTVYGNRSDQSVTMYWGAPAVGQTSNSTAVFDTAGGFRAVWHLNSTCNDATAWNHDGINYGAMDTAGIIGVAKRFSGDDSIVIAGLLGSPATVTLSGWALLDTPSVRGGEIVSLGDNALIRMDNIPGGGGVMGSVHVTTDPGVDTSFRNVVSGLFLARTGWHHVVMTVDSSRTQSLYIDGVLKNTAQLDTNSIYYSQRGTNTCIGKNGTPKDLFNFIGAIDEVLVCGVARSSGWIKLCYMNQKAMDALVVFK